MPEVEELRRRARRAEADGEHREAVELYREAARADRRRDGDDRDPGLLLRLGDLHARLEERSDAVDAYTRAVELYARQGLVTNAVAVCHKILRIYPDETECHRLLAELQADLGLSAEARESLVRYLAGARQGEADPDRAVAAARDFLEEEPDQEVGLRAARMLEEAGRSDEALDLLRTVWERRTGRRQPAGDVEKAVRRLAPDVDIGAWTPEWPPVGGHRESPADAGARDGAASEDAVEAEIVGGEGAVAAAVESAGGGATEPGEGAGNGRVVKRYDRRPGGRGSGGDDRAGRPGGPAGDAAGSVSRSGGRPEDGRPEAPGAADAGRSAPSAPGDEPPRGGADAPGEEGDEDGLRRGLDVLEELLEVDPENTGLRRRKVQYARRLGDPELLEEALVELGDLLADRGAVHGARLVYREVLDRLDPRSRGAEAGLRAVEADARSAMEVALEQRRDPDGEARPTGETEAAARGVDDDFRQRLSEALDRMPRELGHLQAAGLGATGAGSGGAAPWWAHRELGLFLLFRGRAEQASQHLAAARDRAPPEGEALADVLYHLGIAYRRAGDEASSRDCFRRLAERDPGFATAWAVLSG